MASGDKTYIADKPTQDEILEAVSKIKNNGSIFNYKNFRYKSGITVPKIKSSATPSKISLTNILTINGSGSLLYVYLNGYYDTMDYGPPTYCGRNIILKVTVDNEVILYEYRDDIGKSTNYIINGITTPDAIRFLNQSYNGYTSLSYVEFTEWVKDCSGYAEYAEDVASGENPSYIKMAISPIRFNKSLKIDCVAIENLRGNDSGIESERDATAGICYVLDE